MLINATLIQNEESSDYTREVFLISIRFDAILQLLMARFIHGKQ